MSKPKISVIIPVYNASRYLPECFDSLLNQKGVSQSDFEVVVVNDGSTDDSESVIKKYEKKFLNFKYKKQENKGVSAARNNGIKNSDGKYLIFLDADDYLGRITIKSLLKFWMKYKKEIDLVALSIINFNKSKKIEHPRMKYFYDTGVYDLILYPYLSQTTVTVSIKNNKKFFFNETITFAEDQEFNNRILFDKQKIGFCREGKYFYRKHGGSTLSSSSHPFYSGDTYLHFYKNLIERYKQNKTFFKYIEGILLYEIHWRLLSDRLLPHHYSKNKEILFMEKFKDILKILDTRTILDCPFYDMRHKMYLLKLKGVSFKVRQRKESIEISVEDNIIFINNRIKLSFYKISFEDNCFKIDGFIDSYITDCIDNIHLIISQEGIEKEIPLFESNLSYYHCKIKTNKVLGFNLNIPSDISRIKFFIKIDENKYKCEFTFDRRLHFFSNIKGKYFFKYKKHILIFDDKKGDLVKEKSFSIKRFLNSIIYDIKIYFKNPRIGIFRSISNLKLFPIWLYYDRKNVLDNSYYQFLYDKKKFDLILKFYIYDGDERPEGISSIQGVRFGSFIHKVLFLLSSVILTSYSNFESFSPFKKSFKEYRDKVKFKTIYLQHGILHAKLREMYTQEKNSIDKVVVSSYFEKENFVKNYNYREEDLLESGMPRLDRLGIKKIKGSKKILLAPSWRQYLLGAFVDNKWEVDNKQFMSSYFFKSLHQFLSSKKLKSILEKSHSILELKLHPNFSGYKSCFKLDGQVIKFSDDIVNPSDYDLLITDYSSYVFDYVYCNIPVIYFLPDREEFEAGLGTYRELDLPLEEGFGPITENSEDLIKEIKSIVKNNFEIDKKYRNRYRNFFITKENHREKLYKELKKLK